MASVLPSRCAPWSLTAQNWRVMETWQRALRGTRFVDINLGDPAAGLRGSADCGSGLRYALGRFSPRAPLRELAALSASKARPGEVIVLKAQAPLLGGCTSFGRTPATLLLHNETCELVNFVTEEARGHSTLLSLALRSPNAHRLSQIAYLYAEHLAPPALPAPRTPVYRSCDMDVDESNAPEVAPAFWMRLYVESLPQGPFEW